eukprot:5357508-Prymnesium_polylepis.1
MALWPVGRTEGSLAAYTKDVHLVHRLVTHATWGWGSFESSTRSSWERGGREGGPAFVARIITWRGVRASACGARALWMRGKEGTVRTLGLRNSDVVQPFRAYSSVPPGLPHPRASSGTSVKSNLTVWRARPHTPLQAPQ